MPAAPGVELAPATRTTTTTGTSSPRRTAATGPSAARPAARRSTTISVACTCRLPCRPHRLSMCVVFFFYPLLFRSPSFVDGFSCCASLYRSRAIAISGYFSGCSCGLFSVASTSMRGFSERRLPRGLALVGVVLGASEKCHG